MATEIGNENSSTRQRQLISYQSIDETTGKEIIGFEFRRGLMSLNQMKDDESKLLPFFLQFMSDAQKNA